MNLPIKFIKDIQKDWLYYLIFIVNFFLILYILAEACPKIETNIVNSYEDIMNELQTGDLILFSCEDFISKGIRYTLNSTYSHGGIIIRDTSNKLLILECDMTNSYDFLSKKKVKTGAHLLDLKEKIYEYDGTKFGYRKLISNHKLNNKTFHKIFKEAINISFQHNWVTWMAAHFKANKIGDILKKKNTMFCTQYIADVYIKLGILSKDVKSHLITPADFEKDNLKLNSGFKFGPIINFRTYK
ncbi:hypothetical protein CPAV1605_609 [seawater metagenome]|uniref:Permuted papain-like amidase enzyme, YaeF/YiiX, C92 family n=1 Tax=seawater metagenome TaxID=1561972 RepID=A0A5E8CJR6_9ZZZZ